MPGSGVRTGSRRAETEATGRGTAPRPEPTAHTTTEGIPMGQSSMLSPCSLIILCAALAVPGVAAAQTLHQQFEGLTNFDWYGRSVANAGDVNGDGVDDIVVGIPNGDPGGIINAGMARVYSGVTGAVLFTVPGTVAGDHMGWAVAGAGDVDGDNHADIIVSAVHSSTVGLNRVHVISGVDNSIIYIFNGSATDWFGYAVSGAGDVDGDGLDDVLIGNPMASRLSE